jgi:hypothetical protein
MKMEQHALKKVNNHWNTKNSFYLETSGGQNCNPYLIAAPLFKIETYIDIVLWFKSLFTRPISGRVLALSWFILENNFFIV